jgi:hypothetical protein
MSSVEVNLVTTLVVGTTYKVAKGQPYNSVSGPKASVDPKGFRLLGKYVKTETIDVPVGQVNKCEYFDLNGKQVKLVYSLSISDPYRACIVAGADGVVSDLTKALPIDTYITYYV